MTNKELKIIPPEGYCIDEANSTFECIKFKPKSLTYEDVAKELFFHKESFEVDTIDIYKNSDTICYQYKVIAKSAKQLEKLLAINKLMNVAKYLNGDWKPDWDNINQSKYHLILNTRFNQIIEIGVTYYHNINSIYFKSQELAQQAIDILGEDTIRLALSTDW